MRATLAAAFEAPVDADAWKIAARRQYRKEQHINEKEADSAVTGVRWAARSPHTRNCRLVLMSDSTAVVGAFRKGRSNRPGMLRQCRRLAAICLAEAISVEMRHIPSERNMSDQPSRGGRRPGPCDGRGHEQTSATKRGKETYSAPSPYAHPGSSRRSRSVPPAFWSPLLDANIGADTHARYLGAVSRFVVFVRQHGDGIASADDFDYWLSYYAHVGFVPGRPAKSEDSKVLYAFEC